VEAKQSEHTETEEQTTTPPEEDTPEPEPISKFTVDGFQSENGYAKMVIGIQD